MAYGDTIGQVGIFDITRSHVLASRNEHSGVITSLSYNKHEGMLVSGSEDNSGEYYHDDLT